MTDSPFTEAMKKRDTAAQMLATFVSTYANIAPMSTALQQFDIMRFVEAYNNAQSDVDSFVSAFINETNVK